MVISKVIIDNSYIHLNVDTAGIINLKFILDQLSSTDKTDTSSFAFQIKSAEIINSRFHFTSEGKDFGPAGVNYADMDMRDLNLDVSEFVITGDTLSFEVRNMNLREKSGFTIKELNTDMSLSGRHMDFANFNLVTPYSNLSAKNLKLSFKEYGDFSDFVNSVGINFSFNPSLVSFNDISFFATPLIGYDEEFRLSGDIKGQISNMKGKEILLVYKDQTRLMTNFTMIGLPEVKTTFMHFDIVSLQTNSEDLQNLKIPGGDQHSHLKIPNTISGLGTIKYSGKFTGYFDDFVAYGRFSTSLGEFSSDLLLRPDSANTLYFQGRLKTKAFFLGKLMKQDSLVGKITMNANINGYTSKTSLYAKMDGLIDSLEFNRYNYKNINITGTLTDKVFDGSLNISDPNIKMDFLGKVNFSNENPEFAFTADVSRARPYYLHLENTDPSYFASFLLETNFTGKTIDQLNGEIRIVNSLFRRNGKQLQIYNLSLLAVNTPDSNLVRINSDVMDLDVNGRYQFSKLTSSFKNLASFYLPSLEKNPGAKTVSADPNSFNFKMKLKNIQPLILFFAPSLNLGNNTDLYGHYRPELKDVEVNLKTSLFSYNGNEWQNLSVRTFTDKQNIAFQTTSSSLTLSNDMVLDNLTFSTSLLKDTANISIIWDSKTKPLYKGEINAIANLKRNQSSKNPIFGLHFLPAQISLNDTVWTLSESNVVIDSSSIAIDSFKIRNQNQNLLVYGTVSENPEDAIRFSFLDMDLNAVNPVTKKYNFDIAGKISGQASIKDPYHNLLFLSDLQLNELVVNGESLGKGEILANWNNRDKKVHIKSFLGAGLNPALKLEGDFFPRTKALDFTADLDKLKLNIFHTYSDFLVSDVKGIANGRITIGGTGEKPDINGSLRLMKTAMTVDYLQTRYNFSNDVKIVHNNIILKDFEAFDEKGNKAIAQGSIDSKYFREFSLNIKVRTDNFAFLNTTEKDNSLFYGRIFAGGVIAISGPTDNLLMNIDARSNRNSEFYIPLYASEEVAVQNFIDWVSPRDLEPEAKSVQAIYEVKMKGIQMNFNLEVTPDAQVQLIFDPKVGDIIKGRGTGNLKILINTLGKFEIYGDMVIDEGDYLFTLKNVINKKFSVEKGGRISWNGDPTDANIDLKAVYNLKTTIPADWDLESNQQNTRKRIPVECVINMSGKLMNPTIKPDVTLPGADQKTQSIVKSSINTDEELMKQFVSLLVMNNFYVVAQGGGNSGTSSNAAGVTTTELLSNQLSSWLSQISKDFDIGVNYRPGDQISSDELQVALSTQILNDRISISGNLDMGGNSTGTSNTNSATNTKNIVGDFDINFKITDKLHLKAFNRANDNLLFQSAPYTQGVGLFYKEYFNNLKELGMQLKKPFVKKAVAEKPEEDETK
jgi:hypothetical protein